MARKTFLLLGGLLALTVLFLSFSATSTRLTFLDRGSHLPGIQIPARQNLPRIQSWRTTVRPIPDSNLHSNNNTQNLNAFLLKIVKRHHLPNDSYFGYNVSISDKLPLYRNLSDRRNQKCRDIKYNLTGQVTVSVIIPFYNEALTPLLRHIHTLLHRTPSNLLQEIILVDDKSTLTYLGDDLDRYFQMLDKRIRIIRNKKKQGLIRTRMNGARQARGDVLVFLDAHMEVGVAWLEPLLERIVSQSRIVVQPLFLGIRYRHPKTITNSVANEEEFDSEANDFARPGMSWDLGQNWFPFPSYLYQVGYNQTSAMPAPGLQGSCIVARRSYFMSIRGFDEGLNIWGGEQLELALKVWMTGGRVETVPCSHIGHVFKDNPHIQTEEENDILIKNCLRIAEIWMDEYAEFVIASARAGSHSASLPTFTSKEVQSIEEGRAFREHIGSESFEWYLTHVFPELKVPSRNDILWGEIKNNEMCLFVKDNQVIDIDNVCESYGISCRTIFSLDQRGRLSNDDQCFGLDADTMSIVTVVCDGAEAGDGWEYTEHDQLMYKSPHGTYCIGYVKSENIIHLEHCKPTNDHQSWDFQIRFEWD